MLYEMLSGINPFKMIKNKFDKLKMIKENDVQMLPTFSEDARSLLKGLTQRNVSTQSINIFSQNKD